MKPHFFSLMSTSNPKCYSRTPPNIAMKSFILASSYSSFIFLFCFLPISIATDTINTKQIIRDGDTLVSSSEKFEFGFFSPGSSTNRYVGIWYKRNITVKTVVWVANRETPLVRQNSRSSSGVLTVISSGQLVIRDDVSNNNTIWSTNTSRVHVPRNPVLQLLDTGNLVVREANDDRQKNYIWQSFDYPSDTLLPGMSIGYNPVTGIESYLSSWRSYDDPTPEFTFQFDTTTGYPQIVIKRAGAIQYRLGPWNGIQFTSKEKPIFVAATVMNTSVVYYREDASDESVVTRFTLGPIGVGQRWTWVNGRSEDWVFSYSIPKDLCDTYRICGAHGLCNSDKNPVCGCLDKFVPKVREGWIRSDWSGGCVRRSSLNCGKDVFLRYSGIKLPYSSGTLFNESFKGEECKAACLRNCSCMAYANVRTGVTGCFLWFGDLIDIRRTPGAPQEIYIRMAASELDSDRKKRATLIAILTSVAGIVILGLGLTMFLRKRLRKEGLESDDEDLELPMYDLSAVNKATNSLSNDNKLGEGGFGPVYKGVLEDGKEVAVKRLSATSSQGVDEFKNEVICIAKLQHRNLVKLLGCCIQGHEKMLIYEYLSNKSLDLILFDKTKSKLLDWQKRFHIITGTARGLLYLHQDSHLRIIHRDLKASNVLLDDDLNPKISDFGMARIFGGNETEANTKRVVGTYGYMSPEYAGDGLFSVKSDIYSFGVLVLEIVSGQRNRGFQHSKHHHNLLGHAWMLYKDGMPMELVDPNIVSSVYLNELLRSIHVALLCVQHSPEDRPTMSSVIMMLGGGSVLPEARLPGFFSERHGFGNERTSSTDATRQSNEYTITLLEAR
ncbi:hypothetical protein CASFOL_002181 [Castilleja foliolosa]|uniref:Receptor-like serine/threonine-protein kinase n=1 Tax=Castilleja foliolosa TaxID=1961234 RepID=A0ABD3EDI9_9LAMI